MQTTLETVLPVFALVLCGYLAGRFRLLGSEGARGLGNFVYYLAVPALLFSTMARGVWAEQLDIAFLVSYFLPTLLMFPVALLLGRALFGTGLAERAVMGLGCSFGNTVLLGIPLVVTAFGEAGMVPLTLIIAFHAVILFAVATVILEFASGRSRSLMGTAYKVTKGLITNPIILSLGCGALFYAAGWAMPNPAASFLALLSYAVAPCALVSLGASLVQFKIGGDLKESLVVTAIKLYLHPIMVAAAAFFVFDVAPLWAAVAVITAALPAGVNVFIFAQQYNIYLARAASVVLISTALSVISVSLLIAHFAS